jgi:uncharacterized protein YjbI with pentapeptide repeats
MANPEHLAILKQGVEAWNKWREENPSIEPDLRETNIGKTNLSRANLSKAMLRKANLTEADLNGAILGGSYLSGANLCGASLIGADLSGAFLSGASIIGANLSGAFLIEAYLRGADLRGAFLSVADLKGADLIGADLSGANLSGADLSEADLDRTKLCKANLSKAKLRKANLSGADLSGANLSEADFQKTLFVLTKLNGANLSDCRIFGISAWDLELKEANQKDLIITQDDEPIITVDNLEVAQFVYLLLNNEKIRNVIDTIGKKGVLILGRFTEERKIVLDAIRNKLRKLGFVPMMFDFEKPTQRDFTETIKTLAGLSRFIIADITNPKSSPLELQATMPDYMIPFVPIIQEDEKPFSMFQDLKQKYGEWVLDPLEYDTAQGLLDEAVIAPANEMARQLELKKAEQIRTRHVRNYEKTRPLRKAKKGPKA